MTEDTYIGDKVNVISLNRYAYANDNHLRYVDPNGLWAIIISLNGIINPLIGIEGDIGFAIGYNKYEGIVAKPVVSGGAVFSSHPGVSGGLSATIDFRDIPVGSGLTTSYGGSVGMPVAKLSVGGDINIDTNTGEFAGITIGGSFGVLFNPSPVEFHGKEIWSYAHYDRDEIIKKSYRTWEVDGYPIANASDIPITSKNSLDENDKYILSKIMDRNYVEYYNRGCK